MISVVKGVSIEHSRTGHVSLRETRMPLMQNGRTAASDTAVTEMTMLTWLHIVLNLLLKDVGMVLSF